MQKELNPELFGEKRVSKTEAPAGASAHFSGGESHFLNLDRQVFELRSGMNQVQESVRTLQSQLLEQNKNMAVRMERIQQAISRLEQSHNGLALEAGQKISTLNQKIQERRALEAKVQEMVERHNSIVKSFEVRMNQLQKLLSDKENQVAAAQAAINEAKMEIARLKRF